MDEVEELAKAMYEKCKENRSVGSHWDFQQPHTQERFRNYARAALAHLSKPKPPEPKDEWREAIEQVVGHIWTEVGRPSLTDSILAAIAPLREKANYTVAQDWRDEAYRQEKRADAAEAKLARIEGAMREDGT